VTSRRRDAHATITTTVNINTHVVDAAHRRAIEAVEDRLFRETDANGRKFPAGAEPPDAATDCDA
jgi:hypothetical protein